MRMVKCLMMASVAGLAVTAGAQAADMPLKAKPVEYVKVCSLYGAGFFYIPGTDTCLRVGGHIRAETSIISRGTNIQTWNPGDGSATQTRDRDIYYNRTRGFINTDTRTQTSFGTLRTFFVVRQEVATPVSTAGATTVSGLDAGFLQWGGFTAGRAGTSFMDTPWNYAYKWGTTSTSGIGDTAGGRLLFAYTHQFGNGWSGSLSVEDSKHTRRPSLNGSLPITYTVSTAAANGTVIGPDVRASTGFPDLVAQLRLDQAWGGFHIAGEVVNNRVAYNCGQPTGACTDVSAGAPPADKLGYAVNSGLRINIPGIGVNDALYIQGSYAAGATRETFANIGQGSSTTLYGSGAGVTSIASGYLTETVYNSGVIAGGINPTGAAIAAGGQQLTVTYGGNIGFEHGWNNEWRTSIYGGVAVIDYNRRANAILCSRFSAGSAVGVLSNVATTCNMDYMVTGVGSRTYWSPVRDLQLGVEALWSRHHSSNEGATFTQATVAGKPAGAYQIRDQDVFSGFMVMRRFF